jgi:hypothetical protein
MQPNTTHTTRPTLTINLSEFPSREAVDRLEAAAVRFGCSLEWDEEGLSVWSPGRDLLFDCFLITLSKELPLIRPQWDLSIQSMGQAA